MTDERLLEIVDSALEVLKPKIENIGANLFKVTSNDGFIVYTNQKGLDRIMSGIVVGDE